MTFIHERERLILEELAVDCLDIRELHRHGYLDLPRVPRRWPEIRRIRTSRHLIYIEFRNQVTPQHIHISWTPCNFGGQQTMDALPPLQSTGRPIVQRAIGLLLSRLRWESTI